MSGCPSSIDLLGKKLCFSKTIFIEMSFHRNMSMHPGLGIYLLESFFSCSKNMVICSAINLSSQNSRGLSVVSFV